VAVKQLHAGNPFRIFLCLPGRQEGRGQRLFFCLIIPVLCFGLMNEPFPTGYSMINFGTILQGNRISGRQPWTPACFAKDSARFSLSSAYINYYDDMDNLEERNMRQAAIGMWFNVRRVDIKCSGLFFNALGIYGEQKGFFSVGYSIARFLHISAEVEALRAGLLDYSDESETMLCAGASVWAPWSFASASFSIKNITIQDASVSGFRQPISMVFGIHTMPHRVGSQGVVIIVEPENEAKIRFCIGEEFSIHKTVAISAALSSQPLMLSFGLTFNLPFFSMYSAFVQHPVLGWSQGVGMEWVKR